ncbi:MAG TPA: outer membrane protein transport protein [Geminicoccaceae bacterium]|nr:outer membrane protein transport protein [Geminicoccus sp.]HMU50974.1 outer membrane protein transport protein [Geminicoccaceae bacterium]
MLLPGLAQAAGLWINEMATPDMGTASAGRAALAQDAATVFGNPAGMTALDRSQVLVGLQVAHGSVKFDRDRDLTTVDGNNGHNASGTMPGGALYGVHAVTDKLRLGLWHGSYFAGDFKYDSRWAGRYYVTKDELVTLGAGINAAYEITDWLSVGGGPFALYGKLDQGGKINNLDPRRGDGDFHVSDSEVGYGGMAGVMLTPKPGTRLGVSYISPVELDFEDVLSTSNLGPLASDIAERLRASERNIDLGITVPQQVMLSGFHQLTPKLALMANLTWQDWSEFGKVDISIDGPADDSATTDLDYDDTWGVAVGAQYRVSPGWLWSVGAGFDTSPMGKSERTPTLPLDAQYRFGTGIQHDLGDNLTVGVAYQLMYGGDAELDVERGPLSGRVAGDYGSYLFHFANVTLIWRF